MKVKAYKKYLPAAIYHSISEYRDIKRDRIFEGYLRNAIRGFRPDFIWERSWRLQRAGLELARELDIPYVMEWKDNLTSYGFSLFRRRADKLESRKLKNARWVVVESTRLKHLISREEGLDTTKFLVALNGVDYNEFWNGNGDTGAKPRLGLGGDSFVVGYVGSFAWYHEMELIVEAADFLKKDGLLHKVLFLMVGDGGIKSEIEQMTKDRGLESHFRFTGRVPMHEVPEYLAVFDCAVLPGCTDIICPIKVPEYMAAGLPVVIPDYEPNREVITPGKNGLLFTPHDPKAIGREILFLKNHQDSRTNIGEQARQTARETLSWEKTWGRAAHCVATTI